MAIILLKDQVGIKRFGGKLRCLEQESRDLYSRRKSTFICPERNSKNLSFGSLVFHAIRAFQTEFRNFVFVFRKNGHLAIDDFRPRDF